MNRHQLYMRLAITDIGNLPANTRSDYKTLCQSIPSLVLTNGLAITVAFLKAKVREEGGAHRQVLTHLEHILETDDLASAVSTSSSEHYMAATLTVLDAWVFYKRFAESMIPDRQEPGSGSPDNAPSTTVEVAAV